QRAARGWDVHGLQREHGVVGEIDLACHFGDGGFGGQAGGAARFVRSFEIGGDLFEQFGALRGGEVEPLLEPVEEVVEFVGGRGASLRGAGGGAPGGWTGAGAPWWWTGAALRPRAPLAPVTPFGATASRRRSAPRGARARRGAVCAPSR